LFVLLVYSSCIHSAQLLIKFCLASPHHSLHKQWVSYTQPQTVSDLMDSLLMIQVFPSTPYHCAQCIIIPPQTPTTVCCANGSSYAETWGISAHLQFSW
jgi:hypothetical protein